MKKEILLPVIMLTLSFAFLRNVIPQQAPSKPIAEVTFTAGEPFSVVADMLSPIPQDFIATANYILVTKDNAVSGGFNCYGNYGAGQRQFTLSCSTTRQMPGGEYKFDGTLHIRRSETGEAKDLPGVRLPIVTVKANPYDVFQSPVITGARLLLTAKQTFTDGAFKAEAILEDLSAHFPTNTKDSKENRRYLLYQAEAAKIVVDLTRDRYVSQLAGRPANLIVFQDFDRRFDQIIRELGGNPSRTSSIRYMAESHFLLAQMPKTKDSVDARSPLGTLQKDVLALTEIIVDEVNAFKAMAGSGTTSFSWSITTNPPGADIYITRLNEPETQWSKKTNLKGQTLEYARWTFRIDWNGCSRKEYPNAFLENPVLMEVDKTACKQQ